MFILFLAKIRHNTAVADGTRSCILFCSNFLHRTVVVFDQIKIHGVVISSIDRKYVISWVRLESFGYENIYYESIDYYFINLK